jgi:nucleoside-diphosphate-sugar epimerase
MTPTPRILITGGTGFVGRPLLTTLKADGIWNEIHATHRQTSRPIPTMDGVHWHEADLLDETVPDALIDHIQPSHVIHTAWVTDHGTFWNDPANARWLDASLKLANAFIRKGGKRFVNLGSVAEYEWQMGRMVEGVTPEHPATPYGAAKLAFHRALMEQGKCGNVSTATARVFFVYGPYEKPGRLVPTACRAIINGQPEAFGSLFQWRDFLHVTDLARGIVALTRSDLEGAVNIGSGGPVRLNFLLDTLEKLSGRSDLFQRGARKDPENDPPILFADVAKLAQTGWLPLVGYEEGLANALNYWRDQLT